jgi:hypothetical protein
VASTGTNGSAPLYDEGPLSNEPRATASSKALDGTGLPLPRGTRLFSTGTVEAVRVLPADDRLGPQTRIVAGGVEARAIDNVYQTSLSYRDAVAFYDRILELGNESPYSRDGGAARRTTEGHTTKWAFADDSGNSQRVVVSDMTPTRISIEYVTAMAAVKTEPAGRANAQPGTELGRSEAEKRDGGRSAPSSSGHDKK